nr:GTP-binding protein [Sodalis-like endosymbiont of Proechinophthirus fluctus]
MQVGKKKPCPVERLLSATVTSVSSAHIDAGKTTKKERILFFTDVNHKNWRGARPPPHDGLDGALTGNYHYLLRYHCLLARDSQRFSAYYINIIDTLGYVDFAIEVEPSVRVLDDAVMTYDAVGGCIVIIEMVWRQADKYRVPCIAFVNKINHTGAGFEQLKDITAPVLIPVGA